MLLWVATKNGSLYYPRFILSLWEVIAMDAKAQTLSFDLGASVPGGIMLAII